VTGLFHTKKDMDRRERELAAREQELAGLEEQVRSGTYKPKKNFPPFLGWWAWHPAKDLPEDVQPGMRKLRWLFIGITIAYAWNLIGTLSLFSCKDKDGHHLVESIAVTIVLAVFFLVVLSTFSFEFIFFYFYKAFKGGRAIRFFVALVLHAIWFLVLVFNIVGIVEGGSVGIWLMSKAFDAGCTGVGVIGVIFAILAVPMAVAMLFAFRWLWRYYRQKGLAGKAKEEAAGMAVDYAKEHPDQAVAVARVAADHT
jgi:hypothetical protein